VTQVPPMNRDGRQIGGAHDFLLTLSQPERLQIDVLEEVGDCHEVHQSRCDTKCDGFALTTAKIINGRMMSPETGVGDDERDGDETEGGAA